MDHILHGGVQGQSIGFGYRPLGKSLAEWITQESYSSKIAFVVHQPKDNIVAAERLAMELGVNYHVTKWGVGLRNRSFDAYELEYFIKKESLIKAAKANGIWKRPPILTEVLLGVITGIIIPLLSYVLDNSFLPTALAGIILLILTGHYIHKYRVCQEEGFSNLKTAVKKFSFDEYHKFIRSFDIAKRLLDSNYSRCWYPLAVYFKETEVEEMTEEHNQIALLLYQYCKLRDTGARIEDLQHLKSILNRLLKKSGFMCGSRRRRLSI